MRPTLASALSACALAAFGAGHAADLPVDPTKPSTLTLTAVVQPDPTKLPKPPFFHDARLAQESHVTPTGVYHQVRLAARFLQGDPELVSLEITGAPVEITGVTGVAEWALRTTAEGARFLDLKPSPETRKQNALTATILAKSPVPAAGGTLPLALFLPGNASSGDLALGVSARDGWSVSPISASGLVALKSENAPGRLAFSARKGDAPSLQIRAGLADAAAVVGLENLALEGELAEDAIHFRLHAEAVTRVDGEEITLLRGDAALAEAPAGARLVLGEEGGVSVVKLRFDKAGRHPVALGFVAKIITGEGVSRVNFAIPGAKIGRLALFGFDKETRFEANIPVSHTAPTPNSVTNPEVTNIVPPARPNADSFVGHLPAGGDLALSWKRRRDEARAKCFFTTDELADIRVGDGLAAQTVRLTHRVLQGEMDKALFDLVGQGEVLAVRGDDIRAWQVVPGDNGGRRLEVLLARPRDGDFALTVDTRTPLGAFPAEFSPVRVTPVGAVRHGGLARIGAKGAVRLAVTPAGALTQINPNRFPGAPREDASAFAYRVSSPDATYRVQAEDIMPEVAVTQTIVHRLTETSKSIEADIELEVREAPLREFTVRIPRGYIPWACSGAEVAEHNLVEEAGPAADGLRPMVITFTRPVSGKRLLRLRLVKNTALAGDTLAADTLAYPGVKSVRGFLGFTASPGLRLTPAQTENLAEIATAFFPQKIPDLQHAFRLRDARWAATLKVERLAHAVQSDVLHQYLVRDGAIAAGTVVNYVIVGSPVASLRFAVPSAARNLEFTGGDIRAWKRDGDTVEVSLNRPVLGAFTLLATFELPLDARGGEADLSGVRPLGVQSEQGHVLVTAERPHAVTEKAKPKNLITIEPAEIPPEYKLLADAPLLAAYQYSGSETGLRLDLRPRETRDSLVQVVDYAELQSKVGADGQTRTEMRCLVKSRGGAHLRVTVPAGARLWTVTVDDQAVLPAQAGENTVLVPIPAKGDANAIAAVKLTLAGKSGDKSGVRLVAPALDAPIIQTSWTVEPDKGRKLAAEGGDLVPTDAKPRPRHPRDGATLLACAGLAGATGLAAARLAFRRRAADGKSGGTALTVGALALAASVVFALAAAERLRTGAAPQGALHFAGSFLEAGRAPTLAIAQTGASGLLFDAATMGFTALAVGLMTRGLALRGKRGATLWRAGGWAAATGAALSLPDGYAASAALGAGFVALEILPAVWRTWRRAGAPAAGAAAMLALVALAGLPARSDAAESPLARPLAPVAAPARLEALTQTLRLTGDRLLASAEARCAGVAGDSFELLRAPAALLRIDTPAGVRLTRARVDGVTVFRLTLDQPGAYTVKFEYELPVAGEAGDLALPTGRAIADSAILVAGDASRAIGARGAISRRETPSGLAVVFPLQGERALRWGPKTRDVRAETPLFYAENESLFTLSPGLAEGRHRVTIKPSRGMVATLSLDIPAGLAVSGVRGEDARCGVSDWRFDPEKGVLTVSLTGAPVPAPGGAGTVPATALPFSLLIDTQSAIGALPAKLALESLAVRGAAGATGRIAVAGTPDLLVTTGDAPANLSRISVNDIQLRPESASGEEDAPAVLRAYRHGAEKTKLPLVVAPVESELRVDAESTVSVGEDRTVLSENLTVSIRRAGVFSLKAELPPGYDIESVSGDALSHWSESREGGKRFVTLHLRGRTLGDRRFAVTLAGPGVAGAKAWRTPGLALQGVSHRSGKLVIVPEEGIRLHSTDLAGVTQADPGRTGRKGTLAFGFHHPDWRLGFEVENATPWVRCDWLQEITLSDGRVRAQTRFDYAVENAAVKAVRVRLPVAAEGVRWVGELVADAAPVPGGEPGLWEVKLRRRVLGKLALEAVYRLPGGEPGKTFALDACAPADAAVRNGWVIVRPTGRLAAAPAGDKLPDTLRATDWAGIPAALRRNDPEAPLILRAGDTRYTLPVKVSASDPSKLLPVRVRRCDLDTTTGDDGATLTRVRLELALGDKRPVRFTPPAGAKLWHAFVNDRTVRPAVEGADCLLPVEPNPDTTKPTVLEVWYAAKGLAPLPAPKFDLPLENITWSVRLPEGATLAGWKGDFEKMTPDASLLPGLPASGGDGFSSRVNAYAQSKDAQKGNAESLIKLGNKYRAEGDQERALQSLSLAKSLSKGDAALNEDARVQYNNLRLEQIEYGLNRRRLENLQTNGMLPQLAPGALTLSGANAYTGNTRVQSGALNAANFTAEDAKQLRDLNAAEDNTALRKLAERFVSLQEGAASTPEGIRTVAPANGRRIVFAKSLLTEPGADLRLAVTLRPASRPAWLPRAGLALAAFAAAVVALLLARRKA